MTSTLSYCRIRQMVNIEEKQPSLGRRIIAALRLPGRVIGMIIILMAIFLCDAILIEPRWIKVTQVNLSDEPTHTLVHISDIHYKGNSAYLRRAVKRINKIDPDFVCLTGDLVETDDMLPEALDLLCEINAPLYVIPGNHDYWCKKANQLTGASFDAILAGHSHGGQVRVPFYGALIRMTGAHDFQQGLYDTPAGPLYVNRGLGTYFLDIRFLCRPEITVISL